MNYVLPFVTIAAVACISPVANAQENKLSFGEALELYSALIENATQGLKLIKNEEAADIIAGEIDKLTAAAEQLNGITAQMDVTEQDLITAKAQLDKAQSVAIKLAEEVKRLLDNNLIFPKLETSLNQFITASGALELLENAEDDDTDEEEGEEREAEETDEEDTEDDADTDDSTPDDTDDDSDTEDISTELEEEEVIIEE